jgi:hypothetical protein
MNREYERERLLDLAAEAGYLDREDDERSAYVWPVDKGTEETCWAILATWDAPMSFQEAEKASALRAVRCDHPPAAERNGSGYCHCHLRLYAARFSMN